MMSPFKCYQKIQDLLVEGRVKEAFAVLKSQIGDLQDWPMMDDCARLEETYNMMLKYFAEGVEDDGRSKVYHNVVDGILMLEEKVKRRRNIKESSSLYYSKLRTVGRQARSLRYYTNRLQQLHQQDLFLNIVNENGTDVDSQRKELLNDLFDYIWVIDLLTEETYSEIENLLLGDYLSCAEQAWMISGLTLSILYYFDKRKLSLLEHVVEHSDEECACRAMVGLALVNIYYTKRLSLIGNEASDEVGYMLTIDDDELSLSTRGQNPETASESANWCMLQLQFLTTYNTRRIRKQFDEQIMPLLLKMRNNMSPAELQSLLEDESVDLPSGLDPNLIHKIQNRIQSVTEQAMNGVDVYYQQFAQMKSLPFFREVRNWLKPFALNEKTTGELMKVMGPMMGHSRLCDSDKYSLSSMIGMLPQQQLEFVKMQVKDFKDMDVEKEDIDNRENLLNSFRSQSALMDFAKTPDDCLAWAPMYLQDMYRLFNIKLKNDKEGNPFMVNELLVFITNENLDKTILERDFNTVILEAYGQKLYKHTLQLLSNQKAVKNDDVCLIEAFSHAILHDYESAIESFSTFNGRVDEMTDDMKSLYAICLASTGEYDKAIALYEQLQETTTPYTYEHALALSRCKRYQEALDLLFKEDFLHPNQVRVERLMAWCQLNTNRLEDARTLYIKLANDKESRTSDYINAGHTELILKNISAAITWYRKANVKNFTVEDKQILVQNKVDAFTLKLIEEALSN